MGPWPNTWIEGPHVPPPSPEEGPWTWQSIAQSQHRLWAQWTEAGQTWLQWWLSSLPQMPWPPAGVVMRPGDPPPLAPMPAAPIAVEAAAHLPRKARALRRAAPPPRRHDAPKVNGARHH